MGNVILLRLLFYNKQFDYYERKWLEEFSGGKNFILTDISFWGYAYAVRLVGHYMMRTEQRNLTAGMSTIL